MEFYTLFMANADTNMTATVCCRENVTLREAFAVAGLDIPRSREKHRVIKVNGERFKANQRLSECGIANDRVFNAPFDAFVVTYMA